MIILQ